MPVKSVIVIVILMPIPVFVAVIMEVPMWRTIETGWWTIERRHSEERWSAFVVIVVVSVAGEARELGVPWTETYRVNGLVS